MECIQIPPVGLSVCGADMEIGNKVKAHNLLRGSATTYVHGVVPTSKDFN